MMFIKLLLAITALLLSTLLNCQDIGDPCPKRRPGVCTDIHNCTSVLQNIKLKKTIHHCSFKRTQIIVCCNEPQMVLQLRGTPTKITTRATAAPLVNRNERRGMFSNYEIPKDCTPILNNLTVPRTGQTAFDKCLYYQEKYVYPCLPSPLPGQDKARANFCTWSPEGLIINGENATRGEFPHMALLGFGIKNVVWKCGGTIISEKFVLTAAHCTKSSGSGPVTKIKIGILKISEPDTNLNVYNVFKIYTHKDYKSPIQYYDIALLETDREMLLNPLAFPACLHDGSEVNDTVIITGWGKTNSENTVLSEILQKAFLQNYDDSQCHRYHSHFMTRNLPNGLDSKTQICFGSMNSTSDTCGGDSGGPAQIRHPKVYCMYMILGVTSFGRSCGLKGAPGVYTRVSHFLPWIESVVWE